MAVVGFPAKPVIAMLREIGNGWKKQFEKFTFIKF